MKSFPKNTLITGSISSEFEDILTLECLEFVAELHRKFNSQRLELLKRRQEVQKKIDGGWRPNFLEETKSIREKDWKVLNVPKDLQDRRVEITGPTNKKMIINALNSGASCFMADLEDSSTPSWNNVIEGQINLKNTSKNNFSDKPIPSRTTMFPETEGMNTESKIFNSSNIEPISNLPNLVIIDKSVILNCEDCLMSIAIMY